MYWLPIRAWSDQFCSELFRSISRRIYSFRTVADQKANGRPAADSAGRSGRSRPAAASRPGGLARRPHEDQAGAPTARPPRQTPITVHTTTGFFLRGAAMRAKICFITLALDDLDRTVAFYRDGLGSANAGLVGQEFRDELTVPDGTMATLT